MPPTSTKPTQPLVALSGVAKQFTSGTLALDGLDLAIARGEFVSLLGPSGCGKSTASARRRAARSRGAATRRARGATGSRSASCFRSRP
jgi:NitT/TauT family transport system ATP-binding protein